MYEASENRKRKGFATNSKFIAKPLRFREAPAQSNFEWMQVVVLALSEIFSLFRREESKASSCERARLKTPERLQLWFKHSGKLRRFERGRNNNPLRRFFFFSRFSFGLPQTQRCRTLAPEKHFQRVIEHSYTHTIYAYKKIHFTFNRSIGSRDSTTISNLVSRLFAGRPSSKLGVPRIAWTPKFESARVRAQVFTVPAVVPPCRRQRRLAGAR